VVTAELKCPAWLHKYVIGPRGTGIRRLVGDGGGAKPQVQVSFEEEGRIFLEGPPAELRQVKDSLAVLVADMQSSYTFEVLHVSPAFHRHIIGKSGANSERSWMWCAACVRLRRLSVSKIRQETGVSVSIPSDDSHSDEVRIEGRREGVMQAKAEIMDMVRKMVAVHIICLHAHISEFWQTGERKESRHNHRK